MFSVVRINICAERGFWVELSINDRKKRALTIILVDLLQHVTPQRINAHRALYGAGYGIIAIFNDDRRREHECIR